VNNALNLDSIDYKGSTTIGPQGFCYSTVNFLKSVLLNWPQGNRFLWIFTCSPLQVTEDHMADIASGIEVRLTSSRCANSGPFSIHTCAVFCSLELWLSLLLHPTRWFYICAFGFSFGHPSVIGYVASYPQF